MFIDLKKANLEQLLAEQKLSKEELHLIQGDIDFYDRYLRVTYKEKIGFIRIWRQHVSDPYLDLDVDECDLIGFKGQEVPAQSYINVLDSIFEVPQLVRCMEKDYNTFTRKGFEDIPTKTEKRFKSEVSASTLIGAIKKIEKSAFVEKDDFRRIRLMKPEDLPILENLFAREYPLRCRAVRPMFSHDPKCCFVYEDDVIKGAIFGEEHIEDLYIHQVFVGKDFRGQRIDRVLLKHFMYLASKMGKTMITGTIRGNLIPYYRALGIFPNRNEPKSYYLIRYNLKDTLIRG